MYFNINLTILIPTYTNKTIIKADNNKLLHDIPINGVIVNTPLFIILNILFYFKFIFIYIIIYFNAKSSFRIF